MGFNAANSNSSGLAGLTTTGSLTGISATPGLLSNRDTQTQGAGTVARGAMTSSDLIEAGLNLKRLEEQRQQQLMQYSNAFNAPQGVQSQQGLRQQQQQQSMGGIINNNAVTSQVVGGGVAGANTNFGQGRSMSNELEIATELMKRDPSMEPSKALELAKVFCNK